MALHTPRVEQPQLLWVLTLPIGNKMFSSSPTPILFSGVSLTKLAPGFFFFPLKTHSLQNRQKTQIKGYPEPKIWFLQPPKMETNTCFRAKSTRPKTFLVALWAPKLCSVGKTTGNQIVSPFQPSVVASGLQDQHCHSMEMPDRGFLFLPKVLQPFRFSEPFFRGSRSKRDDCRRLLVTGHH